MKTPRNFSHIDTWVFDLDNTLYPHHVNLWQQVDARIGEFVSACLKISAGGSPRIQKDYYRRYGTTHARHDDRARRARRRLPRLCAQDRPLAAGAEPGDGGCDRKASRAQADPDQRLGRPCRCGAGAARHRRHFEAVFDIIAAELEPKPAPQTYQKFLSACTASIRRRPAMFEDLARNLVVPHQLGMTTVLVVPDGARKWCARTGSWKAAMLLMSITSPMI